MKRNSRTGLRVGLAGALTLFGAACQDRPTPLATDAEADLARSPTGAELYVAELTPLNNSGVSGAAAFVIHNGQFTARVYGTGLAPNRLHPQHIHGLPGSQNSVCPAPDAADDIPNSPESAANPDELISVPEGAPAYGAIRVPLDSELTPIPAGEFPMANAEGIVNYLQKTPFDALQSAVEPFELRPLDETVVVLHGGFVTGPGGEQVYDASLPVACAQIRRTSKAELRGGQENVLDVPAGFRVEKVVDGLQLPTSLAWDDQGRMYVAEAGSGLFPQQLAPVRILRVEDGRKEEVVNLTGRVEPALVGIVWHNGAFYITHRASDLTGAVSRVTLDGQLTKIFDGIIDSQAEHQINDIRVGPDGRMFVAVGPAGNAGVIGPSVAPWVMLSPQVHTTPCEDIVLLGKNFQTPNFLTREDTTDMALTGAYVPFGEATVPGQVIQGVEKCGGSILTFDPNNAEATIETHAWGFRNLIGLAWNRQTGEMYAAENGYDVRGSRPVQDFFDASLRIRQGQWYGVPDFSAGREPLTNPAFEPPDSLQAPVFVGGELIGRELGFLIDHAASGLVPPTPDVVLGQHPFNSSPSMIDVAPPSWGEFAGHAFIAEWGDLAPPTNPLRGQEPAGFRVVRVDPATGQLTPFVANRQPGPASRQGAQGRGLDRPFDVQFGPDGNMYIVDYGVVTIDFSLAPPYAYQPGTGAIWRVVRTGR